MTVQEARNKWVLVGREGRLQGKERGSEGASHTEWGNAMTIDALFPGQLSQQTWRR